MSVMVVDSGVAVKWPSPPARCGRTSRGIEHWLTPRIAPELADRVRASNHVPRASGCQVSV